MSRLLLTATALVLTGALAASAFLVPAIEAGGGGHGGCMPRPLDGANEPVIIENSCYGPAVLYVETGATVEWQQKDSAPHNVMLFDGELVGGRQHLNPGDRLSRTFERAGVFPYYCTIHPNMLGVIVAGDPGSPASDAVLSLQAGDERRAASQSQPVEPAGGAIKGKGEQPSNGLVWREAAIGAGLFVGLLGGLVMVSRGFVWPGPRAR